MLFNMDIVIALTGVLRLFLIGIVFYLNCRALMKVCFRSNLCVHNMVCTAVILANILYLITWPPFLVYGLSNGEWTLVTEQVYCLSQNYVVNAMGMVFLSLLVVRLGDCIREHVFNRPSLSGTKNVVVTFMMWILPQLVYDLISLSTNHQLCQNPVFHFLNEIIRFVPRDSVEGYSLGFMICEQELTTVMVTFHLWQYMVLVLPYTIVILLFIMVLTVSSGLRRSRRSNLDYVSYLSLLKPLKYGEDLKKKSESACQGLCRRRMVIVDIILCSNLLWHLIGRPLMLLHALSSETSDYAPTFLDVGSHLMLSISCCFVPTISCTSTSGTTSGQTMPDNEKPLVSLIQVQSAKKSFDTKEKHDDFFIIYSHNEHNSELLEKIPL